MVVTSFRPRATLFDARSGGEAVIMKSSMWSRPKRVGGVLAGVLGMMAAVGVNPGVATADDVGPGQHLSLSGQCSEKIPELQMIITCDAAAPGGGTTVVCQSAGGCRFTVTASGQKEGEDSPYSSGSEIKACAVVNPLNPRGPYDKVRNQCGGASEFGPSYFNGTLLSGDQATLRTVINGTNWQSLSVQADVDGA
jgi:hypothetical protein